MKTAILFSLVCGLLVPGLQAQNPGNVGEQEVSLHFGDPAPQFKTGRWLKGEAIQKLEKGKIYVIDFWGTKCRPCIASFPELVALQKKYDQVSFIQVTVVRWAADRPYPDTPDDRKRFVENRGDDMVDRVVEDAADGFMVENWMKPSGTTAIPRVFIVDQQGKIAWYGLPSGLEQALKRTIGATVAGSF